MFLVISQARLLNKGAPVVASFSGPKVLMTAETRGRRTSGGGKYRRTRYSTHTGLDQSFEDQELPCFISTASIAALSSGSGINNAALSARWNGCFSP